MSNTYGNSPNNYLIVDTFAHLPTAAQIGSLATTQDTHNVYVFDGSVWQLSSGGGGGGITALTGDVTASGSGSVIATLKTIPNKVYVDFISGNDSNTGTITQPWKTLQHAYNSITPSVNIPYVIYLSGGNNDTDSSPITGKPNVSIIADYPIQVQAITIASSSSNDGVAFANLIFLGPVTWIKNDAFSMGATFIECQFFSGPVIKQQGSGACSIFGYSTVFVGADFGISNGGFGVFNSCTFYGNSTFRDPGSSGFSYLEFDGGYSSGNMSFTGLYNPIYFTGFVHDIAFGAAVSFSAGIAGPSPLEIDSNGLPPTVTGTPGTITYLSQGRNVNGPVLPSPLTDLKTYTSNYWGAASFVGNVSDSDQTTQQVLLGSTDTAIATNATSSVIVIAGDNTNAAASGNAGSVYLQAGNIAAGTGFGGTIGIYGGNSDTQGGGQMYIQAGNSNTGQGGDTRVLAGSATAGTNVGGSISLEAGNSFGGAGGNITLNPGGGATPGVLSFNTTFYKSNVLLVTNLPSAATAGVGARSFVSNATATTFASIVAGGGGNAVPVYSDGTNWRIG